MQCTYNMVYSIYIPGDPTGSALVSANIFFFRFEHFFFWSELHFKIAHPVQNIDLKLLS